MARTPDGLHTRSKTIPVRGTEAWVRLVDTLRGDLSRSAYIRGLIERDRRERAREQARERAEHS